MNIVIVGRGKVACALRAKLLGTSHRVRLLTPRGRELRIRDDVEIVVLAVRDDALGGLARRLAVLHARPLAAAVIHVAGAVGPEVLSPLSGRCAGIGRAHPLASFASKRVVPDISGALWLVDGDPVAVARARRLGRALGCVPRSWPKVAPAAYHAAAALTANGAAALVGASARVLLDAGAPPRDVPAALAVLLRTVSENVARLGLPAALTGPVRRGDAAAVAGHLRALSAQSAEIIGLYRALGLAQLRLAKQIGEATPSELRRVQRALAARPARPRRV